MFEMKANVRFSECDRNRRISPAGIINYFQDCCNLQSINDGMDADYLFNSGRVWVLNSWTVVLERLPESFEDIYVYTWPYDFKGFYGLRNFKLLDSDGKVCAYADSMWTLINMETKRPSNIDDELMSYYHIEAPYPMEHEGRKIHLKSEGVFAGDVEIKPHHLDVNNHMNNAQYVLEAYDYVPDSFRTKKIRVEYRKQTLLGEKLKIYRTIDKESVTIIMKDSDGMVHATIKFDGKTGNEND